MRYNSFQNQNFYKSGLTSTPPQLLVDKIILKDHWKITNFAIYDFGIASLREKLTIIITCSEKPLSGEYAEFF